MRNPTAVFVYGTLKSDQCRGDCWPHPPLSVEPATVTGQLFDLGPYPGLIHGRNSVAGEVWSFEDSAMPETLRILDGIEDYQGKPTDEYHREVITCVSLRSGEKIDAFTYIFAKHERLAPNQEILPSEDGRCYWPPESCG